MIGEGERRCRHGVVLFLPLAASSQFVRWLKSRIDIQIGMLSADVAFLTRAASSTMSLQQ
jgi:hypothetical protein